MARSSNFMNGSLFKPSRNRAFNNSTVENLRDVDSSNNSQRKDSLQNTTASFRYDPPGFAFKNTQQLNIDFSKFENHTFFNSARSKVHVTFDKILNRFPFDGTEREAIEFLDSLTGFEKYVYDNIPKHTGFLNFDSNNSIECNPFVGVVDTSGKIVSGEDKLTIGTSPFTIEFSIYVPDPNAQQENKIIAQRLGENNNTGFTIGIQNSNTAGKFNLFVGVNANSLGLSITSELEYDKWNYIAIVFDRGISETLKIYEKGELINQSQPFIVGPILFSDQKLTLGAGSTASIDSVDFIPSGRLIGSIDEFRFFLEARSQDNIKAFYNRSIYSEENLNLYFRFNEPPGPFDPNSTTKNLVLDHSGAGLHGHINNFTSTQREPGNIPNPLVSERKDISPVLFPSFTGVSDLAKNLIDEASTYDFNNPNTITKLIPKHYLTDEASERGIGDEDAGLSNSYSYSSDAPGSTKMPSSQIISSVLFMWASRFDEIKMFIDEFKRFLTTGYELNNTVSDQMLPHLAKYYGYQLPSLFRDASEAQLKDGLDLGLDPGEASLSLQNIQNTIWRRILTDISNINMKKGTMGSIEALFRNMGINPSSPYRIKEYGGSKTNTIKDTFERRQKNHGMLHFNGSFDNSTNPIFKSPFLSGSRIEPGVPFPCQSGAPRQLTINNNDISTLDYSPLILSEQGGISAIPSRHDGLFTSGSWTYEASYKMNSIKTTALTESLVRIQSEGESRDNVIFNLVATNDYTRKSATGKICLLGRPGTTAQSPAFALELEANIFDGKIWNISFSRKRAESSNGEKLSEYSIFAGRTGLSGLSEFYSASILFDDAVSDDGVTSKENMLNTVSSNASIDKDGNGLYLEIGKNNVETGDDMLFLNGHKDENAKSTASDFTGFVSNIKFFTKNITKKEAIIHSKNPFSLGLGDPKINYNFALSNSGSAERLRYNFEMGQPEKVSDASGNLGILDYNQTGKNGTVSGFPASETIIKPRRFDYQILSPKFELGFTDNKIRPRSFISGDLVNEYSVDYAPLNEFPESEKPKDDRRIGIEISAVQALNDDISNILSTLDIFDNAIGSPELVFSQEYRDLRNMRKVYFNRLENKVNMKKFFQFFKFFDDMVGDIIEDLIPSTSRYVGTNFVIESHMLERQKMVYNYQDMYVGELDRLESTSIFLQQFVLLIKKF